MSEETEVRQREIEVMREQIRRHNWYGMTHVRDLMLYQTEVISFLTERVRLLEQTLGATGCEIGNA